VRNVKYEIRPRVHIPKRWDAISTRSMDEIMTPVWEAVVMPTFGMLLRRVLDLQ
jgi:hypothetical protein